MNKEAKKQIFEVKLFPVEDLVEPARRGYGSTTFNIDKLGFRHQFRCVLGDTVPAKSTPCEDCH